MADEARAMLDALMGGDRNEPLPEGASTGGSEQHPARAPRHTHRSCFDRDICPLYCAWGVDVYELFRNTKSDTLVGMNPKVVDEAAHAEFRALPKQEQDRLGYHGVLFGKLQELVQRCDRTVHRNKEKLRQENAKQQKSRGGHDFVQHVDDVAVAQLASAMVRLEYLESDIMELAEKVQGIQQKEEELELQYVNLLKQKQVANKNETEEKETAAATNGELSETKEEKEEEERKPQDAPNPQEEEEEEKAKEKEEATTNGEEEESDKSETDNTEESELQNSLQSTRMEKQHLLVQLKTKACQYQPLQDSIQNQKYQLEYVKSDTTSDKTVCEVSGNFMSARDADERIAAHYAGKQYVGWKLVRDKLKEMQKEYGRFGPPLPSSSGGPPRYDNRRGGGGRRPYDRDRSRDRAPSPPRWERGGNSHRGGYDRGGGDWRRDRGGRRDGGYRHWR